MITQGLSQHEVNLITKILEDAGIEFQTGSADGHETKLKGGRGDASFYFVDIPNEEFAKLSPQVISKLENLGIFPEMEAPDFSEEEVIVEKDEVEVAALRKKNRRIERILILALFIGFAMFIRKVLISN